MSAGTVIIETRPFKTCSPTRRAPSARSSSAARTRAAEPKCSVRHRPMIRLVVLVPRRGSSPQGRREGLRPSRSPTAWGDGAPQARSGRRPQAGDGNRVFFIRSWRSIMAATPCAQVLSRHILASLAALGRSGIPRSLALRAQPAAIAPLSGTKEKDDRGRRPTC